MLYRNNFAITSFSTYLELRIEKPQYNHFLISIVDWIDDRICRTTPMAIAYCLGCHFENCNIRTVLTDWGNNSVLTLFLNWLSPPGRPSENTTFPHPLFVLTLTHTSRLIYNTDSKSKQNNWGWVVIVVL